MLEANIGFSIDKEEICEKYKVTEILSGGDWEGDLLDVGYVDDTVYNVVATAIRLVGIMAQTIGIIASVIRSFGMEVNFGEGKTEAIVSFWGKGCKAAEKNCVLTWIVRSPLQMNLGKNVCYVLCVNTFMWVVSLMGNWVLAQRSGIE